MIRILKRALKVALGATALMGAASVHADIVMNGTGLASPDATITFSEVPIADGGNVSNQFAGYGLTISGPVIFSPDSMILGYLTSDRVFGGGPGQPYSVTLSFGSAVSGAAFEFGMSSPYGGTMVALLGGNVVETGVVFGSSQPGSFFGFENSAFDSIRLDFPTAITMEIDNVQIRNMSVSAVPEPGTFYVMLAGLGLLGFAARRSRQTRTA